MNVQFYNRMILNKLKRDKLQAELWSEMVYLRELVIVFRR